MGGSVMSGVGVSSDPTDGRAVVVGLPGGAAPTGTEYVSSPAPRIVTPNAVSNAGSTRVRICSVGPAIGRAS
jgi:hypothetical protein